MTTYWVLLFGGCFVVLEGVALATRKDRDGDGRRERNGRTLSELVWRLTRNPDGGRRAPVLAALVGFLAWLAWHLVAGPGGSGVQALVAGAAAGALAFALAVRR